MAAPTRRDEMRRLLRRREQRGLTYQELAEESGVPANTLSWWAWKLRKEAEAQPAFVELIEAAETSGGELELELPGALLLRVPTDFDEDHLRRLLRVLSTC